MLTSGALNRHVVVWCAGVLEYASDQWILD